MKNNKVFHVAVVCSAILLCTLTGLAQTEKLVKRTTYKSDSLEFGMGGTITIVGAPKGSVEIEGWQKNEIEVSAEIEVEASNEADLAKLAEVNGFVLDENFGHIRIISVGTNDRDYMKRTAKKFPKHLLDTPFKINYKIKVPRYADLNINGGTGDLMLAGVDGEMKVNFVSSNARMNLIGGSMIATFGNGTVDVTIPTRGWRGRYADIQLANGTMSVNLPLSFNAEIDATVLREGKIENTFTELKPKARTKFTEKSVVGKAGTGGVALHFTVGDGLMKIGELKKSE